MSELQFSDLELKPGNLYSLVATVIQEKNGMATFFKMDYPLIESLAGDLFPGDIFLVISNGEPTSSDVKNHDNIKYNFTRILCKYGYVWFRTYKIHPEQYRYFVQV